LNEALVSVVTRSGRCSKERASVVRDTVSETPVPTPVPVLAVLLPTRVAPGS